jgi:hypothetical protein
MPGNKTLNQKLIQAELAPGHVLASRVTIAHISSFLAARAFDFMWHARLITWNKHGVINELKVGCNTMPTGSIGKELADD